MAVMLALLADDITGALPMDGHDQIIIGLVTLATMLTAGLGYLIRNTRALRRVDEAVGEGEGLNAKVAGNLHGIHANRERIDLLIEDMVEIRRQAHHTQIQLQELNAQQAAMMAALGAHISQWERWVEDAGQE